jgi:hypothetical protein
MIRQIREMSRRIPKCRKTTVDSMGNITVDQFAFPFDDWSHIVPRTVKMLRTCISMLANGLWWESIVDVSTTEKVKVDTQTGEMELLGYDQDWKQGQCIQLDSFDSFCALRKRWSFYIKYPKD